MTTLSKEARGHGFRWWESAYREERRKGSGVAPKRSRAGRRGLTSG